MCGRFSLDRNSDKLEARFKAKLRISTYTPLFNIAPSMPAACIPMDDPSGIYLFSWGLNEKAKDGVSRTLINARAETVCEKWPFRNLVKKKRCLVLASGYIEWKAFGKQKIPFLHQINGEPAFAMAGLFEEPLEETDAQVKQRHFTILTKTAGIKASAFHDRMPLILRPEEEKDWLSEDPPEKILNHLLADPEPDFKIFSISPKINRSFENDPALLQPQGYQVAEQLSLF
jgi:putative SOS response-associated peptidase YedK